MQPRLLLILVLLTTTACGFHLRGSQPGSFTLDNIYIDNNGAPKLAEQVEAQITGSDASVATSSDKADYVIVLSSERFEKSVLSVSADTGKVEEFLISYSARMDARDSSGKKILENDEIGMSRNFTFDEGAVLGKFSEEETIREDLVLRASSQVLRRLQALIPASK